jgi:adenylate kinase family enzyme
MMDLKNNYEEVAGLVSNSNRIMVIGCSGSGKSKLCRNIAELCDMPHIPMDKHVFWLPGWVPRPKDERRLLIKSIVQSERWIMDGTDPSTFDIRVPRTDVIIWIRLPRFVSLFSAMKRVVWLYGRTRPEMAPGCPERFDFEFIRYIWTFEEVMVPQIEKALTANNKSTPVVKLKSFSESNRLLAALKREKKPKPGF